MSMGIIAGVVGVGTSLYGAANARSQSRRAQRQSAEAAERSQVDPQLIARLAREQAIQNVTDSLALEQQVTPENQEFRRESLRRLLNLPATDESTSRAITEVARELELLPDDANVSRALPTSPLSEAVERIAADDLAAGGRLPADVRNEVARASLARSGRVGGGRLGLSRFITPRDLGLSSTALRESRINRAQQVGGQQFARGQQQFQNQQQLFNNRLTRTDLRSRLATLLSNLGGQQTNRALSLASFGQTLQPPVAGLDPGDFASLFVQNANNAATAGQNAARLTAQSGRDTAELFGGLGGMITGIDWSKIFPQRTPAPAAP